MKTARPLTKSDRLFKAGMDGAMARFLAGQQEAARQWAVDHPGETPPHRFPDEPKGSAS